MAIAQPTVLFQAVATSNGINNITLIFTNEINRLGSWLPAGQQNVGNNPSATAAGTPNTIPLRDANGGFTVSGLNVVVNNTTGGLGMNGIVGQTAGFVNILASDASTVFNLAASKAATFGGPLTVLASGIAVTGNSSLAGNLVVTGVASLVTVPSLLAAAPSAGVVPIIARGFDTTAREVISIQDSAAEHASIWSNGTGQWAAETWTTYPGNMTSGFLFAGFVYPASPASLVVNVAPGSVWNGSTWIENAAGGSVTYTVGGGAPLQLPTTNPRIDVIGFNAALAIVVVNGVENASPVPPALPAAFTPLAYIKVRPSASQIQALGTSDTGTQSYIYRDIRANYVNPTGLGPSGAYSPLLATFITDADETGANAMANAKRLGLVLAKAQTVSGPAGVAGPFGGPDLIRTGWTSSTVFDAALSTLMKNRVTFNLQSNPQKYLNKQSATVFQLIGGGAGDLIAVDANGSWRVIGVTLPVTISGSSGAKCVYADCTGPGPGFTLGFGSSAPSANSGQIPLCWIYWDSVGATIQDAMVDYSPLGVYSLFNDAANRQYGPYTVLTSSNTTTALLTGAGTATTQTGLVTTTLYFPRKCRVKINCTMRFSQGTTPTVVTAMYAVPQIDGSGAGLPLATISMPASGIWDETATTEDYFYDAAAGTSHTFSCIGVINTAGVTGAALPNILYSAYRIEVN